MQKRIIMGVPPEAEDGPPLKDVDIKLALKVLKPGKASEPDMITGDIS